MAWFDTRLARLVGTRYPMIQAPMAGVNTPELVAAVSDAGHRRLDHRVAGADQARQPGIEPGHRPA